MAETIQRIGPPAPPRIVKLPLNERGYPVPWFVAWIDGKPDFRVIGPGKRERAIMSDLCWVCGEKLGVHRSFLIGPMCAVNRTTAEPPCHTECARYAAIACPFLARSEMRRRKEGLPEHDPAPGVGLERNPGASLIWTVIQRGRRRGYMRFRVPTAAPGAGAGWLIELGPPEALEGYALGRRCGRAEILASIESGTPLLSSVAAEEGMAAIEELHKALQRAEQLIGSSTFQIPAEVAC